MTLDERIEEWKNIQAIRVGEFDSHAKFVNDLISEREKLLKVVEKVRKFDSHYKWPLEGEFRACCVGCDMGYAGPGPIGQHDPDCPILELHNALKEIER